MQATAAAAGGPLKRATRRLRRAAAAIAGFVFRILATLGHQTRRGIAASVRVLHRLVDSASRAVRPDLAVGLIALVAAGLLAASQFSDYRGVGVGSPDYSAVSDVAPAPQVAKATPVSAHSYVLVAVAVFAVVALYLVLVRRRWQLGRAVLALGAVGVLVSLAVDLPKGLREGRTAVEYAGAHAELIGGFWVELFASAILALSGILLVTYVRREGAGARHRPRKASRPNERARRSGRSSRLAEGST